MVAKLRKTLREIMNDRHGQTCQYRHEIDLLLQETDFDNDLYDDRVTEEYRRVVYENNDLRRLVVELQERLDFMTERVQTLRKEKG